MLSYFLQLQSLDFPKQWLHGHPSGHSQAPAIADLTSVDTFATPTPNISVQRTNNERYIFFIFHHLLVIKQLIKVAL